MKLAAFVLPPSKRWKFNVGWVWNALNLGMQGTGIQMLKWVNRGMWGIVWKGIIGISVNRIFKSRPPGSVFDRDESFQQFLYKHCPIPTKWFQVHVLLDIAYSTLQTTSRVKLRIVLLILWTFYCSWMLEKPHFFSGIIISPVTISLLAYVKIKKK
jgi:hypothetical protein